MYKISLVARAITPTGFPAFFVVYFSSGYRSSFSGTPSSSRRGLSSWRYCSYCPLFSTLALMPAIRSQHDVVLVFGLFAFICSTDAT